MARGAVAASAGVAPVQRHSRILVAVDFGTTFSGVAYTFANEEEVQNESIVTEWGEGLIAERVPTVLRYKYGGTTGTSYWGFDAVSKTRSGEKMHEWFKLGLCPELEHSRAVSSELLRRFPSKVALPPVSQEQCEELVITYLSALKQAVDRLFASIMDGIQDLPREYIITVPAMWSHGAQETMRKCAAEAFLGDQRRKEQIQMVAEPEAAGIYALSSMREIGLEKGDTFVICDAGGGTVDLSSYTITSMDGFISLMRVSTISGELYGSSFLNRIFEDYLTKKKELRHIDWTSRNGMRLLWSAIAEFESTIKPQFTGNENDAFYLTTPFPSRSPSGEGIELVIPADDIRVKVFDLVISKICSLVSDQIRNTVATTGGVKEVLLAGGFGQNAYLKRRLEQEVGEDIKVRKIENSRTAIVRGALMAGLSGVGGTSEYAAVKPTEHGEGQTPRTAGRIYARNKPTRVTARQAPRHYGTRVYQTENSTTPARRNGRNQWTNEPCEIEVMEWFVKKGEEIRNGEAKKFGYEFKGNVKEDKPRPVITCKIYSSKEDIPPSRPHTKEHPVPSLAKPLAILTIDLNTIDSLPYEVRNGRHYYEVEFDVYMTLNSAELTFSLGRGEETYKPATVTVNEWLS